MALITEEIQVPASTRLRTKALKCDLCGKQSPTDSWGKDSYDVNEVTIEHKVGYSYPDSHDTKTTCVDLCPACFKTRLLPCASVTPPGRGLWTYAAKSPSQPSGAWKPAAFL